MDTAPTSGKDLPERSVPGERPWIGVPSIPVQGDSEIKPAAVPSIDVVPEGPAPHASQSGPPAPASSPGGPATQPSQSRPSSSLLPKSRPSSSQPSQSRPPRAAAARPPLSKFSPSQPSPRQIFPGNPGEESFTPAVRAKLKSYVYLLVDPRSGRPFHVGRGRDDHCFDHLRAARATDREADHADGNGSFAELERIRRIESDGRPVRIEILRYGLSSDRAAVVATAAHELLGLSGEPPAPGQRGQAVEVQARLTKRAKFKRPHQVVLLRVGPAGSPTSYEEARRGWRVGRRWIEVDAPRSPRWAVIVVGEIVDSVYRLDGWEPWQQPGLHRRGGAEPAPEGTGARLAERYSFVGTRDAELERRYVGKSVAPYLGKGSAGSVAYVWCGPHWVNTAG